MRRPGCLLRALGRAPSLHPSGIGTTDATVVERIDRRGDRQPAFCRMGFDLREFTQQRFERRPRQIAGGHPRQDRVHCREHDTTVDEHVFVLQTL